MNIDEIKEALPLAIRKNVNQEILQKVQDVVKDQELAEAFRENFISYSKVLQDGKFKLKSYIEAIKYVCFKFQDRTNFEAYSLTFPDKMARFAAEGRNNQSISAYVAMYHKSKLVTKIMEEAITPMWLLNRDNYQKAINTQLELMTSSNSDLVRTQAANSILNHLKQPETKKVEIDVGIREDNSIQALKTQMEALAKKQLEVLQSGVMNAKDIAESKIIEGEVVDED